MSKTSALPFCWSSSQIGPRAPSRTLPKFRDRGTEIALPFWLVGDAQVDLLTSSLVIQRATFSG